MDDIQFHAPHPTIAVMAMLTAADGVHPTVNRHDIGHSVQDVMPVGPCPVGARRLPR